MRILIVEDEVSIARDIEWNCRQILKEECTGLRIEQTLESAVEYMAQHPVDLLLLDLNLSGKSGFELLETASAGPFHTVIISAHTDRAIEAFRYGVLDFLPKPFERARLQEAFDRYFGILRRNGPATQYLTSRKRNEHFIFHINDVKYFQAAGDYTEAVLQNDVVELLDKSLDRLEQILPPRFFRIHRSYLVDIDLINSFTPVVRGTSRITLKTGETLPLSKRRHRSLREKLSLK